ncbi:MAG: hypothetical protein JXB35_01140 [Anaerolineae bacterium]|nr:hypothetical protein [Anaerolineae bacterium]
MKIEKLRWGLGLAVVLALLVGCGTATQEPEVVTPEIQEEITVEPQTEAPAVEQPATEEPATEEPATEETATEEPEETTAPTDDTGWMADGVISEGEYTDQADFGRVRVWWAHDGEFLYLAMQGDTEGWVSVGIEPSRGMQDADFLFGYVENGEPKLWDAFGTATGGANHPPDEELGGADDIVTFAGVELDGVTTFELQIPLDSGDQFDKVLAPGNTYKIIVAVGGADEYNGYHSLVRSGEMTLR